LYLFPYDWRLDLETTADRLRKLLRNVEADGAEKITVVAHSMGGLVSRLALETQNDDNETWLSKVDRYISLAVPHRGAPLALARVLGLDAALGISAADFKRLGNDERYPSGYQLLPAPGEDTIWDQTTGGVESLDIFKPDVVERLELNSNLLDRARFIHETLDFGRKPAHLRYFHFAGTGHETLTRINITSNRDSASSYVATRTQDGGDGTVPLLSALDGSNQRQIVVNEHAHVFRGSPFKRVFFRLLGGNLGPALEAIAPGLTVQLAEPVIEAGKTFRATVSADRPTCDIRGELVLERLDDRLETISRSVVGQIADGTGETDHISLSVPGIGEPGYYRLSFESDLNLEEAAVFAVGEFADIR
jgi:pimeloyl-ACP methyl ester carboxylesterase